MDEWALGREYESSQGAVRHEVFGTGPPLVLVHGTPFSSYVWRKVVPALAEANAVYAFDLPGYGSSEKRKGQDVSLAAQGRVLSELLGHWGLDEPGVVGHDPGGAIARRSTGLGQGTEPITVSGQAGWQARRAPLTLLSQPKRLGRIPGHRVARFRGGTP